MLGQSSIHALRRWPPGSAKARCSSLPYLMSTTFQPRFSNSAAIFMNSRSETTKSRLWRL